MSDVSARPATTAGDTNLEGAVVTALKDSAQVPFDRVHVAVLDGVVRLTGNVNWKYQRFAAEAVAAGVRGVSLVDNRITVEIA